MHDPHLAHLLDQWFKGSISPTELKDLEQLLLSSATARREFWEEAAVHGMLHEACKLKWSEQPDPAIDEQNNQSRIRSLWGARVSSFPFLSVKTLAIAACLALFALGIHFRDAFKANPLAKIEFAEGEVFLNRSSRQVLVKAGQLLVTGEGLKTGADSAVGIRFHDETLVVLYAQTEISHLSDQSRSLTSTPVEGKNFFLKGGDITAQVVPQPASSPMVIKTPHAQAKVLGTVLDLKMIPQETQLDVIEGTVELVRIADSRSVTTKAGFNAAAAHGKDLVAKPFLPFGWSAQDIGKVEFAGKAKSEKGIFTIRGSGDDIWEDADAFHFVYQELDGDGEIVARITEFENPGRNAKASLMFRETLKAGSKNATVSLKATKSIWFHSRPVDDGLSHVNGHTSTRKPRSSLPCWLRLVRRGDSFTAYYSRDGQAWETTETGESHVTGKTDISMRSKIYIGLAVSSFNNGILNTTSFDHVKISSSNATPKAAPTNSNE